MRISKDEALRLALSLDTAITALECDSKPWSALFTARAADEALICLRQVRSHALRVHRESPAERPEPATVDDEFGA